MTDQEASYGAWQKEGAMKAMFVGLPGATLDRLTVALRLRWSDLVAVVVSRGAELVGSIERESPEIIVVCHNLKDMSGAEAITAVRSVTDCPLMVVAEDSDSDEGSRAIQALELGADDYVQLPRDLMEVMARAVALMRRSQRSKQKRDNDAGPITCRELTIIPESYEAFLGQAKVTLTPTEFRLLCLLARNRGAILTRETIRKLLWINDYYCPDALKKYVQRLRCKLGDDARNPTWIKTVHGVGYMLV
jgi:DNA-binding response OmpR family regulator